MMDSSFHDGNALARDATLLSIAPGGSIGGSRTKLHFDSGTERQNKHAGRFCAASAVCSFVEHCATRPLSRASAHQTLKTHEVCKPHNFTKSAKAAAMGASQRMETGVAWLANTHGVFGAEPLQDKAAARPQ